MHINNWSNILPALKKEFGCKVLPPLSLELFEPVKRDLNLPGSLSEFYRHCNGITLEWFRILPIYDPSRIKDTWDSLNSANSSKSKFSFSDAETMKRFLIFSEIGGGRCAVFDRNDESIWYEDNELHQTDMRLDEFIETTLRETRDIQ